MLLTPKTHQQELVNFITSRPNTLAWHEVGLGKTLSAVWSARILLARIRNHPDPLISSSNPKALIVLPKYLAPQWRAEIMAHTPDMYNLCVFLPYSQLHRAATMVRYYDVRVIIFDESHYMKGQGTQRVSLVADMLQKISAAKYGFKGGSLICLTGTPMPNSAAELYTTWAMLGAPNLEEAVNRLRSKKRYNKWLLSFTEQEEKTFITINKATGAKRYNRRLGTLKSANNADLVTELIKGFTHFRKAIDCLDTGEPNEIFTDLGINDDKLLEDADITKPEAYMALVERITRAKVPHAIKWINDFVMANPGERLLVFCPYKWALNELQKRFSSKASLIHGDIPEDARSLAKNNYNKGTKPHVYGSYGTMALGHNLQAGHHSLYIGYPWAPKTIRQAQGRTNRQGQTNITHHHFLMSGQNDRRVLALLREKEKGISAVEASLQQQQVYSPELITVEALV